ncbi:thioesterase family protein [Pigmentiphaga aceris]|uniref:Thioesterase family protein n=1 Tax=Pigmentiphaga aceris TaxID=1940612 RepID=A0A5C0AV88_9BURK|nr:thioesterase family protein [Pigmentiphaga aceris]QEI05616.1 thioesterase family protein [Pigmentiphaga aceris]
MPDAPPSLFAASPAAGTADNSGSHPFDRAIRLTPLPDGNWRGHTSADYRNMVGPYGGITAATVLNAILQHPARLGDPVALTVNYAGPVQDGEFTIEVEILRTNRATQHWTLRLVQGPDRTPALSATAVTALRRPAWSGPELGMPVVPPADSFPREQIDLAGVPWTARYDMRFVRGALSLDPESAASDNSCTEVWMRDEPPRPIDLASLCSMCDGFFPRIFLRRPGFVPAGTVSMTVYFHADAQTLATQHEAPVLGVARAQVFAQGFFDQTAQVWGQGGTLLASSHQIVYYKE